MTAFNAGFPNKSEEKKWIQDEAIDPAGVIKPQEYLAAFWIRSNATTAEPREGSIQVVMYLVGGGYITGDFSTFDMFP